MMKLKIYYLIWGIIFSLIIIKSQAQNNALDFDGTNDYVDFGTNSPAFGTGQNTITIEAWIKTTSSTSTNNIVCWGSTSDYSNVQFRTNSGLLEFGTHPYGGSWVSTISNGTVNTGDWVHVAVVKSGTSVSLYINGIADGSGSNTNQLTVNRMVIGKYYNAGAGDYFTGSIDDVRIWDDVRTVTEIRQNMYKELTGSESNLVAYYKFNETTGTSASDSKASYDGTLTNMDNSDWITSSAIFGPKNCLDFGASNDYVSGTLNSASSSSVTIELWVYFNSVTNQQNLANVSQSVGSLCRIVPYKDGSNNINLFVCDASSNAYILSTDYSVSSANWYHLTFIYSSGNCYIYVNGNLAGSGYTSYNYSLDGSDAMYIGSDYGGGFNSDVKIDEFRVWSDVRTATEIRQSMHTTLNGNESGLIGYYNFDNASGTTLQDLSGNNNDGTLINMTTSGASNDWVSSSAYNTWLNTSSTSWSTSSNWSRASSPSSSDHIGIYNFSGNDPTLSSSFTLGGIGEVGSGATLTIGTGGILTIDANACFTVDGNLTNNVGSTGLVIESNSSGDGSLIHSETALTATVKRYLAGSDWHLVSIPITSAISNSFHGFYLYYWDEDDATTNWKYYISTNESLTNISPYSYARGYYVKNVWNSSDPTVSFTGTLVNSISTLSNLSYTTTNTYDGSHILGNPFTSALDWENIYSGSSGISATVYQRNGVGTYAQYDASSNTSTNAGSTNPRYIPVGQGFWIEVTSATNSIGIAPSDCVHNSETFRSNDADYEKLMFKITNEDNFSDETAIVFTPFSTNDYDPLFDAEKKFADNKDYPQLSTVSGGKDICINHLSTNEVHLLDYVILNALVSEGENTIQLINKGFNEQNLFLEDVEMDVVIDLNTTNEYSFVSKQGETNRKFILHFVLPTSPFDTNSFPGYDTTETSSIIQDCVNHKVYAFRNHIYFDVSNTSETKFEVYDINGKLVLKDTVTGFSKKETNLTSGIYIIRLYDIEGRITNHKICIK